MGFHRQGRSVSFRLEGTRLKTRIYGRNSAHVTIYHQPASISVYLKDNRHETVQKLECGPMPNVMAALPNTGGALYSTPQSLADAHYQSAVQYNAV